MNVSKILAWIRFPRLPIEYYNTQALMKLGNLVGRAMYVDKTMLNASRVKYARVSVEIDLSKPLPAKFRLRRRIYKIEYEGLHNICFECGVYGHGKEQYNKKAEDNYDGKENNTTTDSAIKAIQTSRLEVFKEFGPWMSARKKGRRQPQPQVKQKKEVPVPTGTNPKSKMTGPSIKPSIGNVKSKDVSEGNSYTSGCFDVLKPRESEIGSGSGVENSDKHSEAHLTLDCIAPKLEPSLEASNSKNNYWPLSLRPQSNPNKLKVPTLKTSNFSSFASWPDDK